MASSQVRNIGRMSVSQHFFRYFKHKMLLFSRFSHNHVKKIEFLEKLLFVQLDKKLKLNDQTRNSKIEFFEFNSKLENSVFFETLKTRTRKTRNSQNSNNSKLEKLVFSQNSKNSKLENSKFQTRLTTLYTL